MILVDTSVWIDYLHRGGVAMSSMLAENSVLMHPFVFGELAMGSLRHREATLRELRRLPEMLPARDNEVLALVDRASLHGTGIGFIDAHLLASVRLTSDCLLWTRDRRLLEVAARLHLAAPSSDT